jgi:hypothetical protein
MRFAYVYFMKGDPDRVGEVAPDHVSYWRGLALPGYQGGPFTDRSGGLLTFDHGCEEEAACFAAADPFRLEDLLKERWLKVWAVE